MPSACGGGRLDPRPPCRTPSFRPGIDTPPSTPPAPHPPPRPSRPAPAGPGRGRGWVGVPRRAGPPVGRLAKAAGGEAGDEVGEGLCGGGQGCDAVFGRPGWPSGRSAVRRRRVGPGGRSGSQHCCPPFPAARAISAFVCARPGSSGGLFIVPLITTVRSRGRPPLTGVGRLRLLRLVRLHPGPGRDRLAGDRGRWRGLLDVSVVCCAPISSVSFRTSLPAGRGGWGLGPQVPAALLRGLARSCPAADRTGLGRGPELWLGEQHFAAHIPRGRRARAAARARPRRRR